MNAEPQTLKLLADLGERLSAVLEKEFSALVEKNLDLLESLQSQKVELLSQIETTWQGYDAETSSEQDALQEVRVLMADCKDGKKAVALLYDQVSAPVIKAKGEGELAWEILRLAEQHGVHVAEDPILAETLSYLQLEEEIPEEVYRSVAAILSWVYYLQGRTPQA